MYGTAVVSVCRRPLTVQDLVRSQSGHYGICGGQWRTVADPSLIYRRQHMWTTDGIVAQNTTSTTRVDNWQHCYTKHYVDNTCEQLTTMLYKTLRRQHMNNWQNCYTNHYVDNTCELKALLYKTLRRQHVWTTDGIVIQTTTSTTRVNNWQHCYTKHKIDNTWTTDSIVIQNTTSTTREQLTIVIQNTKSTTHELTTLLYKTHNRQHVNSWQHCYTKH